MDNRTYVERQAPVLIPHDLVADLWLFVKDERDAALDTIQRQEKIQSLLNRMEQAGMSAHLATLEEVQAAWRVE